MPCRQGVIPAPDEDDTDGGGQPNGPTQRQMLLAGGAVGLLGFAALREKDK